MLLLEYISPHKQPVVSDAPTGRFEKANLVGITEVMNGEGGMNQIDRLLNFLLGPIDQITMNPTTGKPCLSHLTFSQGQHRSGQI